MAYGDSLPLKPSKKYFDYYKNGNLNFAGSVRKVIHDLPEGMTFTDTAVSQFLRECGHTITRGKVSSSLSGLANRESVLEKQFSGYYMRTIDNRDELINNERKGG
jgi:predicted DNA-binding ArsR family transcriptional regulator